MATFGAMILAAGMSRRMGTAKALLRLGAQTVIERIAATASGAGAAPIVVVTGHAADTIHRALAHVPGIEFAHNPDFDAGGMRSSVQTGVAAIHQRCDAFFLMLLDQPLVSPATLQALAQHWPQRRPAIVMPSCGAAHGHPLLIGSACADEILALSGDATLHDFVRRHRSGIEVVEVCDRGVLGDLDTPQDYRRMQEEQKD
jgi:CTP:molybdopterin cytidylyltransferase MocA